MKSDKDNVCRFCSSNHLYSFCDLGTSPLANSFLNTDDLSKPETFLPLHAKVCAKCFLVQVAKYVAPENIFDDYAYFSSESAAWLEHSKKFALEVSQKYYIDSVLEIASNDGYLLQYFKEYDKEVLGIEPAANVAQVAIDKGIPTMVQFFSSKLARTLPKFDLIVGNNVLAHTPELNDFVEGVKIALNPEGIAVFEFPWLVNLMQDNQFDTIYHEHFSYFSFLTVNRIFAAHELKIFDVRMQPTHGGSIRIYVSHIGNTSFKAGRNSLPDKMLQFEQAEDLNSLETYKAFQEKVNRYKRSILQVLINLKEGNNSIAIYGAPAKGNTLLNYCGISTDIVDYAVDSTAYKQGRYLPGSRIPVFDPSMLEELRPDIVWIMPWNHKEEILKKLPSRPQRVLIRNKVSVAT